ncbi:MAG: PaaX family transcriptional regulator C-terminal domain-containing protein [Myxococcota bacterium]
MELPAKSGTDPLADLLAHLHARRLRVWSIVVTLFGDAVVPRGGEVWLGVIRQLLSRLDVESGTLGAAMSRLTADGWLERRKEGRLSFYRLAETGRRTFEAAARRIYAGRITTPWDGRWTLVLETSSEPARVSALSSAGFGRLDSRVWARPGGQGEVEVEGLVFEATVRSESEALRSAVREAWDLDAVAERYRRFVVRFRRLAEEGGALEPLDAMAARTLLVHDYRRLVLRDPRLPLDLLPKSWPGAEAHEVAEQAYRAMLSASEAWLDAGDRTPDGPLPPPGEDFHRRFGGLGP